MTLLIDDVELQAFCKARLVDVPLPRNTNGKMNNKDLPKSAADWTMRCLVRVMVIKGPIAE